MCIKRKTTMVKKDNLRKYNTRFEMHNLHIQGMEDLVFSKIPGVSQISPEADTIRAIS